MEYFLAAIEAINTHRFWILPPATIIVFALCIREVLDAITDE